jgi:hypothetical protein
MARRNARPGGMRGPAECAARRNARPCRFKNPWPGGMRVSDYAMLLINVVT